MRKKRIILAQKALYKFIFECKKNKIEKILDIGAGKVKIHTNIMKKAELNVFTCDYSTNSDYSGDFNEINFENEEFDGIWCSHTLEHQLNTNLFLKKINKITKNNGIICITVPPFKKRMVNNHFSLWTGDLLLYNLILAGFDCKNAICFSYGYNISVFFRKTLIDLELKHYSQRKLKVVKKYFPIKGELNG